MKYLGTHILAELHECDKDKLNDRAFIEKELLKAIESSGATIITYEFHKFFPIGVSGVVIIAESHASIHTWPEYRYAALDIFTCSKNINPMKTLEIMKNKLDAGKVNFMNLKRGIFNNNIKD